MTSEPPLVLALNGAPSSLRFALFDLARAEPMLSGIAERFGQDDAFVRIEVGGHRSKTLLPGADHARALAGLQAFLEGRDLLRRIGAVGHRVVHGGERFAHSVAITPDVLRDIEACARLAPLHNPANLASIRVALALLPDARHVAVFDTAFHRTLPPEAYLYGLPQRYRRDCGVRRYGFHGTSLRWVSRRAVDLLGLDVNDHGLIVLHLGEAASATAIANGRSVDTSMGLTPTEDLVMATCCGDVDIGAILHVARVTGLDLAGIERLVDQRGGLVGLSDLSDDYRALEAAAAEGHRGAIEALAVFAHRVARAVGALAVSLERLDAIVFTGEIGENVAGARSAIAKRLIGLGVALDEAANRAIRDGASGAIGQLRRPEVWVIASDEDRMIALDAAALAFDAPSGQV